MKSPLSMRYMDDKLNIRKISDTINYYNVDERFIMQVDTRHDNSFAVARCKLDPGETINVESGAMYAQSSGVTVASKMQGGFLGAAKRALLSGDSFFVSEFTAPKTQTAWVDVVPQLPGSVFSVDVTPGNGLILTKGSWLASEPSVKLDPKFGNGGTIFGGEGLFVVKASGQGKVVAAAYGAIDVMTLAPGETVTVDTGHLVAYEEGMQVSIRKISGILTSLKSGEGLVMDIKGPGDVILQTRNPAAFGSWIASVMPSSGGGGGGLGSIFGG